jgi:uncharacterized membrane protein
MAWFHPTSLLDKVFEGSLLLKGVGATLETIGAVLLIFVPSQAAMRFAHFVTQRELFEDPHDLIANSFIQTINGLWVSSHTFAILFLLIHASIKFIIVIGLLKNVLWVYPFSFITLILTIMYQCYDIAVHFSVGMLLLTLFDVFILWLVWREYKKLPPMQAEVS